MIKCIIWDLDNTIWEGILGENQDIRLRDKIKSILAVLNERGIIHSICSRNDYEVAMKKIEECDLLEYFILPQISWDAKSESVKKILQDLHVRPQDVLFVDDNPFERDEVKSVFPDISVDDGADLEALLRLPEVCSEIGSIEAKERINMYRAEERRIRDKECFSGNNSDFLKTCNIRVVIEDAKEQDIDRIGELVERTNQLNSTAIRYSSEEIKEMLADDHYCVYVASVRDKYGSYGRSGLIITWENDKVLEVRLLIVSCRLIGKGIAQTLMAYIFNKAKLQEYEVLRCLFKRTPFNRPMILLYTMNGFRHMAPNDGIDIYELVVNNNTVTTPEWISLERNLLV